MFVTPTIDRSTLLVLLPKNGGLSAQAAAVASRLALPPAQAVRGEDIPYLANEAARRGRRVFAITGEDLLEEWLASGNVLEPQLKRSRIEWNDRNAVLEKPALCLIARTSRPAPFVPDRVAVCAKYARLAERSLSDMERAGGKIERIYLQGALEMALVQGLADAIIDVVVTGATLKRHGLEILDVLFRSDLATLETQ